MLTSNQITFLDMTDNRTLEVFLTSNNPSVQSYDPNNGSYSPSWEFTNMVLTPKILMNSVPVTSGMTISWTRQDGSGEPVALDKNIGEYGTSTKMTVTKNVLQHSSSGVITYICTVVYDGMIATGKFSFALVKNGKNSPRKIMLNLSAINREFAEIELTYGIENYRYLEIYYHSTTGIYNSINLRTLNANTTTTSLCIQTYENNALILRHAQITISSNIVNLTNDVKINIKSGEVMMNESGIMIDAIYGIV